VKFCKWQRNISPVIAAVSYRKETKHSNLAISGRPTSTRSLAASLRSAGGVAAAGTSPVAARATIALGDKVPASSFKYFDAESNMKEITTDGLCKGKKVGGRPCERKLSWWSVLKVAADMYMVGIAA
jgi:hypothetical protein